MTPQELKNSILQLAIPRHITRASARDAIFFLIRFPFSCCNMFSNQAI